MEDIGRDKEEEEREYTPEEERPSRKKRYETLPKKYYDDNGRFNETIFNDIDTMLSSDYYKKSTGNIDSRVKEVKNIRFALDHVSSIPAKCNSSSSSSDVFKNTRLVRDKKNRSSTTLYVKYKGGTAFRFEMTRDYIGDRVYPSDKKVYNELKEDLNREIEEFKKDTFAGQVTERLEQSEPLNLKFVDDTIRRAEREELRNYRPIAYQPSLEM